MAVTAQQIEQYIKTTPFEQRRQIYSNLGLGTTFGDFRGTPEQNQILFSKAAPASLLGEEELAARAGVPVSEFQARGIVPGEGQIRPAVTAQDVINKTQPEAPFDPGRAATQLFEEAGKQAEAEIKDITGEFAGTVSRGQVDVERGVGRLTEEAKLTQEELARQGKLRQGQVGEEYAAAGLFRSGKREASQAEVAQEVATKQAEAQRNLGDQLYNLFSDTEKQFGTEFIASLSIPEAEEFTKLPAPVRGAVMSNYQQAIEKAKASAGKQAQDTLNRLGYQMLPDGTIVSTLAREKEERIATEPTKPTIREYVADGRRVRELLDPYTGKVLSSTDLGAAYKPEEPLTRTEEADLAFDTVSRQAGIDLEKNVGTDGFVDPSIYMKYRNQLPPTKLDDYDKKFANRLNPEDQKKLGIVPTKDIDELQRLIEEAIRG